MKSDRSLRGRMLQQQTVLQQSNRGRAEEMADGFRDVAVEMPEHRGVLAARLGKEHDAAATGGRRGLRRRGQLVEDAIQFREIGSGHDAAQHGPAARLELRAEVVAVPARLAHLPA